MKGPVTNPLPRGERGTGPWRGGPRGGERGEGGETGEGYRVRDRLHCLLTS